MSAISGSSISLLVGDKVILVSYVSMSEWDTFSDILLLESKEGEGLLYLLWCSLKRADASVTQEQVKKIIAKYPEYIKILIDKICDLSLPKISDKKIEQKEISLEERERNIKSTYRILSRLHNWTPQEISDMSPFQICSYLMGGKTGTGLEKMTGEEYRRLLSARGKL